MRLRALLNVGSWTGRGRPAAPGHSAQRAPPGAAPERAAELKGLYREASAHWAAGRIAEAEAALGRLLAEEPEHAEALLLQGLIYAKSGRLEDAADSLLLAAHFRPGLAEAHFQLGLIAAARGDLGQAERCYREALARDPGHARAHNALGAVLVERGLLEEAVACFERALEADPQLARAHSNLGSLLVARLDRFEEGARHIERARALAPEDRDVLTNWAMLLQYRGRLAEAIELCDRLLAADPGDDTVRLNRALALLKQGQFARGWADYEARKSAAWAYAPRRFPFPEWKGEPLAGRTLLVHGEQGLGDQIMFGSCLPDVLARAARCVIECHRKLAPIFRRSFPAATVVSTEEAAAGALEALAGIDFQVAIGSLPRFFRKTLEDFPAHGGYLRADATKVRRWRERLAALPGARHIGISWRGGLRSSRQSVRSIPLAQWLPLLRQHGVSFVSLQYTDCREELAALESGHGIRVHHWPEAIEDYDETAALVAALDLVISVQTAVAHLAGALGRPAWVMVPVVAEWRYLQSGARMPWYLSLELWRQPEEGKWDAVIAAVAQRLASSA